MLEKEDKNCAVCCTSVEVTFPRSYLPSFLFPAAVGAGASGCGAEHTHHGAGCFPDAACGEGVSRRVRWDEVRNRACALLPAGLCVPSRGVWPDLARFELNLLTRRFPTPRFCVFCHLEANCSVSVCLVQEQPILCLSLSVSFWFGFFIFSQRVPVADCNLSEPIYF